MPEICKQPRLLPSPQWFSANLTFKGWQAFIWCWNNGFCFEATAEELHSLGLGGGDSRPCDQDEGPVQQGYKESKDAPMPCESDDYGIISEDEVTSLHSCLC